MCLEVCLQKICTQFELLRFATKGWHSCCEWLRQLGDRFYVIIEFGCVAVTRQLLEVQHKLFCCNRRRGFLTAKLFWVWGRHYFLLAWWIPRGSSRDFLLELLTSCDILGQVLNTKSKGTFRPTHPLQDEDHSGNGPRCTSGSLCHNFEKCPE